MTQQSPEAIAKQLKELATAPTDKGQAAKWSSTKQFTPQEINLIYEASGLIGYLSRQVGALTQRISDLENKLEGRSEDAGRLEKVIGEFRFRNTELGTKYATHMIDVVEAIKWAGDVK